MLARFKDKNILLLQGPLGPFFKRFSLDLREAGARVHKINFCGGDRFYFKGPGVTDYTDTLFNWPLFLQDFIRSHQIDAIFLLGDCRPYHLSAIETARTLGAQPWVFEEGYLRPEFITLEKDGVNGNSRMSKDPDFYRAAGLSPRSDIRRVGRTFWRSARFAMFYYLATTILSLRYRHYVHHRDRSVAKHIGCWLRGAFRKYYYRLAQARILPELTGRWSQKYFLFPLQVHNDYQFKHADYATIEDCIAEVVASFAAHAPADTLLVIKHHPADRPYRDYSALLRQLAIRHHIQDRVLYVHDLHLPTLLRHARGSVLMNSTVGIASLQYGTPVKVLGRAIYVVRELTSDVSLDDFWKNPGKVDMDLFMHFRGWLEANNQLNGSFYRRIREMKNHAGVNWSALKDLA